MDNFVVTIGREYGSRGREIGRLIADSLGIDFYDRDLVDMSARQMGLNVDIVARADEVLSGKVSSIMAPYGVDNFVLAERMVGVQSNLIQMLAEKGPCVIIGRCSDYVLRKQDNCFNVFVFAPFEKRVARIMESLGISEKAAEHEVGKVDKSRNKYYRYVTGHDHDSSEYRHILMDSSVFGVEKTAAIITGLVKEKFSI